MLPINEIIALDEQYYMPCFGHRIELCFTHGEGCTLFDQDGKAYTDFLSGIATNALGYNHPGFSKTLCEQAQKILHTSNYFYIESQALLAKVLCENTCADKAFFGNSGAEANEAAIKLARKYFYAKKADRYEIISAHNSFHGRTLATLAATGQEKYRAPYAPIAGGFINVDYGSIEAIQNVLTAHTAAVMLEPIQGEGGVIEAGQTYLQAVRDLCDKEGVLLIFDEVQTGMGRSGKLFTHQLYGVEPDIFTTAKALGNGLPIGAVLCKDFCNAFEPGDHGTTFGGNPFCTEAALFVVNTIAEKNFLDSVSEKGRYFKECLQSLKEKHPEKIKDIRGVGLLLGLQMNDSIPVADLKTALIEKGFILGTAGQNVLRLVPPLVIEKQQIEELIQALDAHFSSIEV